MRDQSRTRVPTPCEIGGDDSTADCGVVFVTTKAWPRFRFGDAASRRSRPTVPSRFSLSRKRLAVLRRHRPYLSVARLDKKSSMILTAAVAAFASASGVPPKTIRPPPPIGAVLSAAEGPDRAIK